MKTLTKKTHIATIRQDNQDGMMQVCHLLQWSEQQYCEYLFEQYYTFIQIRFKHAHVSEKNRVLYSKFFRGVFNNAAAHRDETEFIPYALEATEEIITVNPNGSLEVVQTIPIGGEYLVTEWKHIQSHRRLIEDGHFMAQYRHILELIKVL